MHITPIRRRCNAFERTHDVMMISILAFRNRSKDGSRNGALRTTAVYVNKEEGIAVCSLDRETPLTILLAKKKKNT